MRAKLITIGNSMGVRLPKAMIEQFELKEGEIELTVEENGILISAAKNARHGWEHSFASAAENGEITQEGIFEGIQNEFDKLEWTW